MRKAVDAKAEKSGFWIFSTYRVEFGTRTYFECSRSLFRLIRDPQAIVPVGDHAGKTLWSVWDEFFWDTDGHTQEEIELLAWDRQRRHTGRLERLRKIRARPEAADRRRELIPEDTRVFVWSRDGGCCTSCGAEDDLQYDHVIPHAKGGGSAPENIQLLCGDCNRAKGDAIA